MADKPETAEAVVLSEADYLAVPPWFHPHPQGQPCRDGCRETLA